MEKVERVTSKQAAKELAMDIESLHYGMIAGKLPIGVVIEREGKKRRGYYIYRGLLDKYKSYLAGKK